MAEQLTRVLSLALRHKPDLFAVVINNEGWTSLPALVAGLNSHFPALLVSQDLIRQFVAGQLIERFEIQDSRIRALYGHSLQHVSVGELRTPPALLFHATQAILLPRIRTDGLLAKGRNGVHLTARWDYALSVRDTHTRKGQKGVILAVQTEETKFKGVMFYQATKHIWLSPYIPARFLSVVPLGQNSPEVPPRTLVPLDNAYNRAIMRSRITELSDGEKLL